MAIPGRKPKPRGEVLPEGGAVETSGALVDVTLECPEHLDKYGREHWNYYVPLLRERGIFSPLYVGPFTLVCESWSIYRQCRSRLNRSLVMRTKNGYEQVRPQYTMMQQAWNSYTKLAEQFGLTPVSRGRLDPDGDGGGPGGDDPADAEIERYLD